MMGTPTFWTLRRGQRLARAGNTNESLAFFAGAEDPDYRTKVQHGLILLGAGRLQDAATKMAQACAAAPEDVVPAIFHAYLLLRTGRPDEADRELERARGLSAGNPMIATLEAAALLLRGEVVPACERMLNEPQTDNLDVLGWALAVVERKIFEAVGTDSGALPPEQDRNPDDAPSEASAGSSASRNMNRGRKLLEAGKPRAALAYLAKAAELEPDDAEVKAAYGAALFEAGDPERADTVLSQIAADGSAGGVAQFYRAANCWRLGRFDEAIRLLDAIPLTGDVVLYQEWFDYVRAMALVGLNRVDEAAPRLAAFVNSEPSLVEHRLRKAMAIFSEKR